MTIGFDKARNKRELESCLDDLPVLATLPESVFAKYLDYFERNGDSDLTELLANVLAHAEEHLDGDAMTLILREAERRIRYRGPDKEPLGLSQCAASDVLTRFTRKLVLQLINEAGLEDVPGGAAMKALEMRISGRFKPQQPKWRPQAQPPTPAPKPQRPVQKLCVINGGK